MENSFVIRDSVAEDLPALEALYDAAFPSEDLKPLLRALLAEPAGVASYAAMDGAELIGHIAFTDCAAANGAALALLGPLAVTPERQRQSVGKTLIHHGVELLRAKSCAAILVLGDPAYYGRFGFEAQDEALPPYPLPEEWADAWRIKRLKSNTENLAGTISVPPPWRDPSLWA